MDSAVPTYLLSVGPDEALTYLSLRGRGEESCTVNVLIPGWGSGARNYKQIWLPLVAALNMEERGLQGMIPLDVYLPQTEETILRSFYDQALIITEALREVYHCLRPNKVNIFAISMGNIALAHALREHPARVRESLPSGSHIFSLVSPASEFPHGFLERRKASSWHFEQRVLVSGMNPEHPTFFEGSDGKPTIASIEWFEDIHEMNISASHEYRYASRWIPITVIHAREDNSVPLTASAEYQKALPIESCHVVDGDHDFQTEEGLSPELINLIRHRI